ncbi:MAG: nucleotidyltransferase family protein [Bacteroidota bacterium]|nr:nucleotidyltransferase family protein [Bacteroidota bacterium]
MILAAGFGTRLAPLTDTVPKALVRAGGKPMIDHAVEALSRYGCRLIVVNAYHHAERLERHFREHAAPVRVVVLREPYILGTGGGILHAREFLDGDAPFLVHNADVVSDFDLGRLVSAAEEPRVLAALAVQERPTDRALLFDDEGVFLGKEAWFSGSIAGGRAVLKRGFCGIHAIKPALFRLGFETGFSDIFDLYRVAMEGGWSLRGVEYAGRWWDLGTPGDIERFEASPHLP